MRIRSTARAPRSGRTGHLRHLRPRQHAGRLTAVAGLALLAGACTPPPTPSVTELVSVDSAEAQSNASTLFTPAPSASDDGRYVAFQSDASNLVAGDTNSATDVFVRDRQTGTTTLVSVSTGGMPGNGPSRSPWISGNGRYVAFDSGASDLVAGDANGTYDMFVRDLQTGTTTLVSLTSGGSQVTSFVGSTWGTTISDDGRFVVMETYAALVPSDTNGDRDIYLRDTVAGTTTRASEGPGGAQISGFSQQGSISGDGRFVAFETDTDGVVPGDSNGMRDVLVKDLQTGSVDIASVSSDETATDEHMSWASISDDGRYVTFNGFDSNLVPGDSDSGYDVFRRDRLTGTTIMVSVDDADANVSGYAYAVGSGISDNGNRVAFYHYGGTPDTNGFGADVFMRDVNAGTTTRISVGPGSVEGDDQSFSPSISGNGRVVPFWSDATNLVTGDANGYRDVFVRRLGS